MESFATLKLQSVNSQSVNLNSERFAYSKLQLRKVQFSYSPFSNEDFPKSVFSKFWSRIYASFIKRVDFINDLFSADFADSLDFQT